MAHRVTEACHKQARISPGRELLLLEELLLASNVASLEIWTEKVS